MHRRPCRFHFALTAIALLQLTCSGDTPTAPRRTAAATEAARANDAGHGAALNNPPHPVLRTTPPADTSGPFLTVTGVAPLTVKFNLCRSEDPDVSDSLIELFHFGDGAEPAFNPDGSFNADFERFCRTEHVYERPGIYLATLIVGDRHLEDQGHDVVALARVTLSVTIVVRDAPPPRGSPEPDPGLGETPAPDLPRVVITIIANSGNMSFSPDPAEVRAGQKVAWQNADAVGHTATQDGGQFDTGFLAPGATSSSIIIGSPGTLSYHCGIHPSMVGTLIVNP